MWSGTTAVCTIESAAARISMLLWRCRGLSSYRRTVCAQLKRRVCFTAINRTPVMPTYAHQNIGPIMFINRFLFACSLYTVTHMAHRHTRHNNTCSLFSSVREHQFIHVSRTTAKWESAAVRSRKFSLNQANIAWVIMIKAECELNWCKSNELANWVDLRRSEYIRSANPVIRIIWVREEQFSDRDEQWSLIKFNVTISQIYCVCQWVHEFLLISCPFVWWVNFCVLLSVCTTIKVRLTM